MSTFHGEKRGGLVIRVYYFGCLDDFGYFLWLNEWERGAIRAVDAGRHGEIPWGKILDGGLAPRVIEGRWRSEAPQGLAKLHVKDGWTAIAFWDRSVDSRPGSNSVFLAEGTHTFDEMVELAKRDWPGVWARLGFEVREVEA